MGKATIDFLMLSEGVQQHQVLNDIKLNILNPSMLFLAPFVPTQLSFSVVFGIKTNDQSMRSQNLPMRMEIISPDGSLIQSVEFGTAIPPFEKAAAIVSGFDIRNMIVNGEGIYTIKAYINNEHEYAQTFMVYTGDDKGNG